MQFMIILIPLLFIQLAASNEPDVVDEAFEADLERQQNEHDLKYGERHSEYNEHKKSHKTEDVDVAAPKISNRAKCIPFAEYEKILGLEFVNQTMEQKAEEIYNGKCDEIDQHNHLFKQFVLSYSVGKNQMIHKPFHEIKDQLAATFLPKASRSLTHETVFAVFPEPTGTAVDEKSFCHFHQPVRDQDSCGSCWAFSVVAIVEALYLRYKGIQTCGSEQMLIDCDKINFGCNGGWPTNALEYIVQFGLSECRYSYVNAEEECKRRKFKRVAQPNALNVVEIPLNGDEELLKRIVASKGPVVVVMHVAESIFTYASGVYLDDTCPQGVNDVSHAVVICGYGVDELYGPYWIVRNSWSPFWGELGYVKVARGRNTCGIASTIALYAEF